MQYPSWPISAMLIAAMFCAPAIAEPQPEPTYEAAPLQGPNYWGTGFFVDRIGHVLTAGHVVSECESVGVVGRGHHVPATVAALDTNLDLGLLWVVDSFGEPAPLAATDSAPPGGAMVSILGYGPLLQAERAHDAGDVTAS